MEAVKEESILSEKDQEVRVYEIATIASSSWPVDTADLSSSASPPSDLPLRAQTTVGAIVDASIPAPTRTTDA